MSARRPWLGPASLAAAAYPAAGVLFGALAAGVPAGAARTAWRLAAFVASALVFLAHLRFEQRGRRAAAPRIAALHVGLAVAAGALLLAVAGPVRAYGLGSRQGVLALVVWPLLTGLPACGVAWLLTALMARRWRPGEPPRAGVA